MGHSLLNVEAITAVSFLLLLFWRVRPAAIPAQPFPIPDAPLCLGLTLLVVIPFWSSLSVPLLHDSYGLVYLPSRQSFRDVLRLFYAHPSSGDFFFRPLSYLIYWQYSKWAHFDAFRWHLLSLAMHAANTALVYILARQLMLRQAGAATAALLFGLHGSRPEAVVWAASRVDMFATLFVLLTLLSFNRLLATQRTFWCVPLAASTLAAVCCKESAFCLPFLLCALLLFRNEFSRGWRAVVVTSVICTAAFVYRYWVIGSVGGYGAAAGRPTVLHFSIVRTANALFYRQWALAFFPINWSERPTAPLWLALAIYVAVLLAVAIRGAGDRRVLLAALAMSVAAALPVQHLLLIGTDLNGARVLYLPVLGFALFWGVIVDGFKTGRAAGFVLAGVIVFQLAALFHNLSIWREVALTSQRACTFLANEIARDTTPVSVPDLPFKRRGVYFLNNSFPACVMFNSGGRLTELPRIDDRAESNSRVYRWNDSAGELQRER